MSYQLYSFGIGKFGLHYKWPDLSSLASLFEANEPNLWYWASASLPTEDIENDFIDGWYCIITKHAYGTQSFIMNDEQKDAVEDFKFCAKIRREYMLHEVEQGLSMEVEQGLQGTGLQETNQNEPVVESQLWLKAAG